MNKITLSLLSVLMVPFFLVAQVQTWSPIELEFFIPFTIENLIEQVAEPGQVITVEERELRKDCRQGPVLITHQINLIKGERLKVDSAYPDGNSFSFVKDSVDCYVGRVGHKIHCDEGQIVGHEIKYEYDSVSYEFLYDEYARIEKVIERKEFIKRETSFFYKGETIFPFRDLQTINGNRVAKGFYEVEGTLLKSIKTQVKDEIRAITFEYYPENRSIEVQIGYLRGYLQNQLECWKKVRINY